MSSVLVLFFICFISATAKFVPENSSKLTESENATEIQHAICNIFTKEIEASANATITRELKGVCTSYQLESLISKLQILILKELTEIKDILNTNGIKKLELSSQASEYEYVEDEQIEAGGQMNVLIEKYNDTIAITPKGEVYLYFWKVEKVTELLLKRNLYISSPKFTVLGHSLQIQLYPNHLGSSNIALQLRPDSNSFIKKHRLCILDKISNDDICSGEQGSFSFNTEMYKVPINMFHQEKYIENNFLLIKLELYINS